MEFYPDETIRESIRGSLAFWLERLKCGGDVVKQLERKNAFRKKLNSEKIALETSAANEQHYEVPTEFFKLILGPRLKYSCCYYPSGNENLKDAEDIMLNLYCERARIEDGMDVLDLGCGWGSLSLFLCEKYKNISVLAVSNSHTQKQFIDTEAKKRGFKNLKVIRADANEFIPPPYHPQFDRIVSIEMFEHMKNYDILFERVSSWIKPSGLLFLQILCHKEFAYSFNATKKEARDVGVEKEKKVIPNPDSNSMGKSMEKWISWMAQNFFTGGTMASDDLFLYYQKHVHLIDHWRINGCHYQKTLEDWLVKLDKSIPEVVAVFEKTYGAKEAKKHVAKWRMFLMNCSEAFGFANGNEWLVSQYLFAPNDNNYNKKNKNNDNHENKSHTSPKGNALTSKL